MKHLDLFSGIGGFALGLESTGAFETVAFCEQDLFCRHVLARHWPEVPIFDDVRTITAHSLHSSGVAQVDIISAGFPCQDISWAGNRAGLEGSRSGLARHIVRLAGELGPDWVLLENVPNILGLGLGDLLGPLSALGYDCVWDCVPASALGAPHRRDRWWCIAKRANANGGRQPAKRRTKQAVEQEQARDLLDGLDVGRAWSGPIVSDAGGEGLPVSEQEDLRRSWRGWPRGAAAERDWWAVEPDVDRVAHGVPCRVDRLTSLGNSIVPQMAALLGATIAEAATEAR